MNEVVSHLVAGRILGVSIQRLGFAIAAYEELVVIVDGIYGPWISNRPEVAMAFESNGSDFLKAALLSKCIATVFGKGSDNSQDDIRLAACAASANTYFLEVARAQMEARTDSENSYADLLLVSMANNLFE